MASYLPPTETLPIFDNSVFDSNNSTALTYAEAKKYFITYPIAQGTTTITDFITGTISYLSPASGSFFNIGTNQVSGGTVRIGPTGSTSGVSVHAGNIDFTNNTINNATAGTTGNITLANSQTSGILNIATGATRTGALNINNTSGATNTINIGVTGTTTAIGGTLTTALGTIAGKTAYLEYNTGSALPTINCSTLNLNATILFFSGATPSGTCILTNIQENQIINIKNWNTNSTPIPFSIDQSSPSTIYLYQYGIDNGSTGSGVTSFSLEQGDSIIIQKSSGKLYQFASGCSFPNGITLPSRTITYTSSQLGYYTTGTGSAAGLTTTASAAVVTLTNLPIGVYIVTIAFNINTYSLTTNTATPTFTTSGGTNNIQKYNVGSSTSTTGASYSGPLQITNVVNSTTLTFTMTAGTANLIAPTYSYIRIA